MFVPTIAHPSVRLYLLCLSVVALAACGSDEAGTVATEPPPADYAGSDACRQCHETQYDAWRASHHALAMQIAGSGTVLGDFSGNSFDYFGVTSSFYRRDDRYYVRTDNAQGELQEYPVLYTFGITPLQQYLVAFPGGRLQALPLAWDSRPIEAGGQRWFHLYPDEPILHGDELHWTGRQQNWNYMCAECHSTDLEKNYSIESDTFATSWSEISVGCEACHGPGTRHIAAAQRGEFGNRAGLVTDLDDTGRATWVMNRETGIAVRSEVRLRAPVQPEACGRCHSRRSMLTKDYTFDRPLMDTHLPSLLDEGLYFDDGQIREEVYVYGSFLQSRMYQAGVSCSDCHEPHAARLRTAGEPSAICATCHLPARFDSGEHHHHPPGTASCVDCHMTSRDFMVIDGRRDHSFRIPRPDLSLATGAPNACNQCHSDHDAQWANQHYEQWFGDDSPDHYGFALHAARTGAGNVPLLGTIANSANPGIARATALAALQVPYSQAVAASIQSGLRDGDPLVRLGALRAMAGLQPDLRVEWAAPLLTDRVLAVRIAAARLISPARERLGPRFRDGFRSAEVELRDSMLAVAERPEARADLANFYAEAGDSVRAEAEFLEALRLAPEAIGIRINLADFYRYQSRDEDAEKLLREGLENNPAAAAYHHALGLLLVRSDRPDEAVEELRRAATLEPANARFNYVYAVALHSRGQAADAIRYLEGIATRFGGDFDIQWALATMLRDEGRTVEARTVAVALTEIYPGIPSVEEFLRTL